MDVLTCPNHHVRLVNSETISYKLLENCIYCGEKMIYAGSVDYDPEQKKYFGTCYKKVLSPAKIAQNSYFKEQNLFVHAAFPEQAIVFSTPNLVYFETGESYSKENV